MQIEKLIIKKNGQLNELKNKLFYREGEYRETYLQVLKM